MRLIIAILATMMFFGCATDSEKKSNSSESLAPKVIGDPGANQVVIPTDQPFNENPNQANVAAGADGKVWHFVCTDGCEGGFGDKKAPCPGCGKELSHNQAYHATDNNPAINTGNDKPQIVNPPTPEPAQNANGVWHYTCAKGCAGGAGAAGPCAVCGGTLSHNSGYH